VPALMLATGMPIMNAVSSSLVAVTAFGMTTAASYAWSGLVSWALAGLFVAGGIAGGLAGTRAARPPRRAAWRPQHCCSPWSLLRWRSICWRVTYPYPGRRLGWMRPCESSNESAEKTSRNQSWTQPARRARPAGAGATLLGTAAMPRSAFAHDDDAVLTEALCCATRISRRPATRWRHQHRRMVRL